MCINREEDYLLIITVQFTELETLLELSYLKETLCETGGMFIHD